MKKIVLVCLMFVSSLAFFACGDDVVMKNMSEITKLYFEGVCKEGFVSSISVGQREKSYAVDGFHHKMCNFSLISLKTKEYMGEEIQVKLFVNKTEKEVTLFYHPINSLYINDLGYCLDKDDEIILYFDEKEVFFTEISEKFNVNYKKAIEISKKELKDEIKNLDKNGKFLGEFYLKILTKNDDKNLFWCFSLITQDGKSYNVLVSVEDEHKVFCT